MAVSRVFFFQLTLTINITPTNITLCILEKKIKKTLRGNAEVDPNI